MTDAGLYALTEEHEAVKEAVREIAEREIAPFAARWTPTRGSPSRRRRP
jgi:Acyl-CoA dehydrogenase, N-terminal domain